MHRKLRKEEEEETDMNKEWKKSAKEGRKKT
jgi:hypothetical protein